MQFSRWSYRSLFAFSYFRLPVFPFSPKIFTPSLSGGGVNNARLGSFQFFSQRQGAYSSLPVVKATSFDEIKDFMKKELTASKQGYEACHSSNWLEKESYDNLIKLVQKSLTELEACKEEDALKKLFQSENFHATLDKHTHLEVSSEQKGAAKSLSWEEARQKMSLLVRRGLSCPKPGIYS